MPTPTATTAPSTHPLPRQRPHEPGQEARVRTRYPVTGVGPHHDVGAGHAGLPAQRVNPLFGAPDPLVRELLPADPQDLDFDPADAERMAQLPVGSWVEFTGEDGSAQPAKLSWVSPISRRLLFVNRRGVRFCVASAEELAAMIRSGRLVVREINTAFEHAMHQVLGKLNAQSEQELSFDHFAA